MKEILKENVKWRIFIDEVEEEKCLTGDFTIRGSIRCRFKYGKCVATLEEKRSVFIFSSSWHLIEITNIANVVKEWIAKYFPNEKTNNK